MVDGTTGAGTIGDGIKGGTIGGGILDGIIGTIPAQAFGTRFITTAGTHRFGEDMDLYNPISVKTQLLPMATEILDIEPTLYQIVVLQKQFQELDIKIQQQIQQEAVLIQAAAPQEHPPQAQEL